MKRRHISNIKVMKRLAMLILCLLVIGHVYGQEICNNGIDDDGDGYIDLNDTVDCHCTPQLQLIPNPSFEQKNCCPTFLNAMGCVQNWICASQATTDYFNCGYSALGAIPSDGTGLIGEVVQSNYKEYAGVCLDSTMHAGKTYRITFDIRATNSFGCGMLYSTPISITLFGTPNCTDMPFVGYDCPVGHGSWQVLGTASYLPSLPWSPLTMIFTPAVDIHAIIVGAPCTLPPAWPENPLVLPNPPSIYYENCIPYFFYDHFRLTPHAIQVVGDLCQNNLQLVSTSAPAVNTAYQWYQAGFALVGQTSATLNVSSNNYPPGVYSLMISDSAGCSVATETVQPPSIEPLIQQGSVCEKAAPFELTTSMPGGTWSGSGIVDHSTGMFDPSAAYIGNNVITYTLGVGTCTASATSTMVVVKLEHTMLSASTTSICAGATVYLTASNAEEYSWHTPIPYHYTWPGQMSVIDVTPFSTSTYSVIGDSHDGTGCGDTVSVTIYVVQQPTVSIQATDTVICAGETVTLTASGANGYEWLSPAVTGSIVTVSPASTTSYSVRGAGAEGCPESVAQVPVTVKHPPTVVAGVTNVVCPGMPDGVISFSVTSYVGAYAISGPPQTHLTAGTYTFFITDSTGCTAIDTVIVNTEKTEEECEIIVPNVITPDGNGVNEAFKVTHLELYPNSSLIIYNRWGGKVYESQDYQNNWRADSLDDGTYFFVLDVHREKSHSGFVSVFRAK